MSAAAVPAPLGSVCGASTLLDDEEGTESGTDNSAPGSASGMGSVRGGGFAGDPDADSLAPMIGGSPSAAVLPPSPAHGMTLVRSIFFIA